MQWTSFTSSNNELADKCAAKSCTFCSKLRHLCSTICNVSEMIIYDCVVQCWVDADAASKVQCPKAFGPYWTPSSQPRTWQILTRIKLVGQKNPEKTSQTQQKIYKKRHSMTMSPSDSRRVMVPCRTSCYYYYYCTKASWFNCLVKLLQRSQVVRFCSCDIRLFRHSRGH